jgi:hypothetical protein
VSSRSPWGPEDEETLLADYLARRVAENLSGRAQAECLGNAPYDVYFVGNLRPLTHPDPNSPGGAARDELRSKLAPMAFGMDFAVHPDDTDRLETEVRVGWSVYYRVFPGREQQRRYQIERSTLGGSPEARVGRSQDASEESAGRANRETVPAGAQAAEGGDLPSGGVQADDEDEETAEAVPEAVESPIDRRTSRRSSDSLFSRWRKIECAASALVRVYREGEVWRVDAAGLEAALGAELRRAEAVVKTDPEALRARTTAARVQVPEDALSSDAAYQTFLTTLRTPVEPRWAWNLETSIGPSADAGSGLVLSVVLANASPEEQQNDSNIEPFFFDVAAQAEFRRGMAVPFRLDMAPRDFRYDPHLPARGFNCAVEPVQGRAGVFQTTMWPVYSQLRYATRTQPTARFADLEQNPVPVLESITRSMRASLRDWADAEAAYRRDPTWAGRHGAAFEADRAAFEDEIRRFEAGLELIRTQADIAEAFRLTNSVFHRLGDHPAPEKRKESWRLFQIVFLVSQLPGMAALLPGAGPAALLERESVDIVYFPTGGGKTEAYLGVIVFHCFFDRFRGKRAGVTAWTRFPLRLLTLQQTQRMADVIGIAELVRRGHQDARLSGADIDPFAVGYFVGKTGSPNELVSPTSPNAKAEDQVTWAKASDPIARQDWKRVARCPACRTTSVEVDFDAQAIRILHRCTNQGCPFPGGVLPVYVVDNDAFRYLPAVMVGTIDKLAGLGNQRRISQLFGFVTGRCPDHGYLSGNCCQKGCTQRRRLPAPQGLSGPTLFVQDELHLLKEGLGTFDAHYETFAQRLLARFGQDRPLKIIASSATIEAFDRQVEHLYGRPRDRARIFPGPGPKAGHSFYAGTLDFPQRLYVGLIPHNKTIFNAVLELLERYHREVSHLQHLPAGSPNPYGGQYQPGTPQWAALLDLYQTSLTYFNATRELNSFRTDVEGDVNPTLEADGIGRLGLYEMTGSTTTDEVSSTLQHLETAQPGGQDAVLATNMVSHGVDVDRLNAMIFYGMPRQNAEYIQASSRVGRSHVGIVFVCLHPARERDRSHFAYFTKYHEFVGKLIEPVAINRWAKFSVERTLPGLFMATLLQDIANNSGEANPNVFYMLNALRQRITDGRLRAEQFLPLLEDAYLVSAPANPTEEAVRAEIQRRVRLFLDQIVTADPAKMFVSDALRPGALTSLRDVDETVPIELDTDGAVWARAAARV